MQSSVFSTESEYYRTLLQTSILSNIIYEEDPLKTLNQVYTFNHGIKTVCVSKAYDIKWFAIVQPTLKNFYSGISWYR
jgi:hypothetical protein